MAASKSYFPRQNYQFLPVDQYHHHDGSTFEFDESDIYDIYDSPELRKQVVGSRMSKKTTATRMGDRARSGTPSSSLPVNVPDWSKILKDEYRGNRRGVLDDYDSEDEEFDGERVPPHGLLARARIASLSVHEGAGRTLKGRDLSRVRNAIWEKIGFQD